MATVTKIKRKLAIEVSEEFAADADYVALLWAHLLNLNNAEDVSGPSVESHHDVMTDETMWLVTGYVLTD